MAPSARHAVAPQLHALEAPVGVGMPWSAVRREFITSLRTGWGEQSFFWQRYGATRRAYRLVSPLPVTTRLFSLKSPWKS